MTYYHNNFDSVYSRQSQPIEKAVVVYIADKVDNSPGSRVIEDLEARLDGTIEVISAMVKIMTPHQQTMLASLLHLRPAGDGE